MYVRAYAKSLRCSAHLNREEGGNKGGSKGDLSFMDTIRNRLEQVFTET